MWSPKKPVFSGKEKLKSCDLKRDGKKYQHRNVFTCTKRLGLFLSVHVDDVEMVEETQNMDSLWIFCRKNRQ